MCYLTKFVNKELYFCFQMLVQAAILLCISASAISVQGISCYNGSIFYLNVGHRNVA